MRDAIFRGTTKFTEFQRNLGMAPNILSSRLDTFVAAGIMHLDDRDYRLTPKGQDLQASLIAMTHWGDRWEAPDGRPIVYEHVGCGGRIHHKTECAKCQRVPKTDKITARPGPGMLKAAQRRMTSMR